MSDPKNPHGLVVGQKLWLVPHDERQKPRQVTIKSMARKWAELEGSQYKLEIATAIMEPSKYGYGTEGVIWLTREAFEAHVRKEAAWHIVRKHMEGTSARERKHLTFDQIKRAGYLLGLDPIVFDGLG
jgi:hypothetical protein